MKPEVKVFTRDNPCTKADLWRCFRTATGFDMVPVPIAHSIIGVNAPRGLEAKGRLTVEKRHQSDSYCLTQEGEQWLLEGMQRYLKNHPSEISKVRYLPRSWRLR